MANRKVLVLNSSLEVLTFVTWERAITHVVSGVARILDGDPNLIIRSAGGLEFPYPSSIIMTNYVHVQWNDRSNMSDDLAAKSAILTRDGFMCMYCGETGTTVDHVMPQSRGGRNTWDNLVCACTPCNSYKADRTPEEAEMELIREPFRPEDDSRRARAQREIYDRLSSGDLILPDEFEGDYK